MASRYLPLPPNTWPDSISVLTAQTLDFHVSAILKPLHLSSTHTVANPDQPADHLHKEADMDTGDMLAQLAAHMATAVLPELHIEVRHQIRSMLWRDSGPSTRCVEQV